MNEPHRLRGALVSIAAPPGTGKSTVLPHLIARARGTAVVADIDEVLDGGSLPGRPHRRRVGSTDLARL